MASETTDLGYRWWTPRPGFEVQVGLTYRVSSRRLHRFPWRAIDVHGERALLLVGGPARQLPPTIGSETRFDHQGRPLDGLIDVQLSVVDVLGLYRQLGSAAVDLALREAAEHAEPGNEQLAVAELLEAIQGYRALGPEPPFSMAYKEPAWREWIDMHQEYRAIAGQAGYAWWSPSSEHRWLYDLGNIVEEYIEGRSLLDPHSYETLFVGANPNLRRLTSREDREHLLLVVAEGWRLAYAEEWAQAREAGKHDGPES